MLPVIIILLKITDCERLEQYFEHCYIFGVGRPFEQISCLNQLNKLNNAPYPVILTTAEASLGHDLTSTAYVIQTVVPASFSVFI